MAKKTHSDMLSWQYRTLLGELSQVTLHASDDSCPCNQVDIGEFCLAKHLLNVSSLASETSLMDEPNRNILDDLSVEALEHHEKAKTIYCKGGEWPDLAQWSREWRKKIEPLYYVCDTRAKAKVQDASRWVEWMPEKTVTARIHPPGQFGNIEELIFSHCARAEDPSNDTEALVEAIKKEAKEPRWCYGVQKVNKDLGKLTRSLGIARTQSMNLRRELEVPMNICKGQAEMFEPIRSNRLRQVYSAYRSDFHSHGIYDNKVIFNYLIDDILSGFRDIEEAREYAQSLKETGNVTFTARGYEIDADALDEVIRIADKRVPQAKMFESSSVAELLDAIRVTGSCKPDKTCSFRVTSAETTKRQTSSIRGLPQTIDEVIRLTSEKKLQASDRTFAFGTSGLIRYDLKFRIVEGERLIVSNDPYTFMPNPDYPSELQPRRRERKSPQLQVRTIAQNLNPDALLVDFRSTDRGAPIIGDDLVVESGNGRVMALVLAATEVPEKFTEYREALKRIAPVYALNPADVDRFRVPILVRERLTKVDRKTFAEDCNAPVALEQSAIEKAGTDADKITPTMLQSIEVYEGESIEDALRAARNKPFVMSFLNKLPPNEQAKLVTADGVLNQDGVRRATLAVFVATFASDVGLRLAESFYESTDGNVKNVLNGIAGSLGFLAQAETLANSGQREAEYAIGNDLVMAVTIFSRIKKTPGMTVAKYIAQIPLQERELSPFQERILQVLDEHSRSGKRIAGILTAYAQKVIDSPPPTQVSFMPGAKITKEEFFDSAVRSIAVMADVEDFLELKDLASILSVEHCNLSGEEMERVLSWRPLRDFVAFLSGRHIPIRLCSIGMTPGFYQLTVRDVDEVNEGSQITARAKSVANMKRIYTPYNERVYEVTIPGAEEGELTWKPQEVIRAPREKQGEQVAMFDYQEHNPRSFIIQSSVGSITPEEFARFKVNLRLERSPDWSIEAAPTVRSPQDVQRFFRIARSADREWLLVLCLDNKLRLVGIFEQAIGTPTEALVSPMVVARAALLTGAVSVILAHNHPSGDPEPSDSDILTYNMLKSSLSQLQIDIPDFFVIGQSQDYSIAGKVYLPAPSTATGPAFFPRAEAQRVGQAAMFDRLVATDNSVRDLPQQAIIEDGQVTVISKVGNQKVSEYSFPLSEWLETVKHPNPFWAKTEVIRKHYTNFDEEGVNPDRMMDSQRRAVDKALAKGSKAITGQSPQMPKADVPLGKAIWQIPLDDFIKLQLSKHPKLTGAAKDAALFQWKMTEHRPAVKAAIDRGELVPPEVLKDYPIFVSPIYYPKGKPSEPVRFDIGDLVHIKEHPDWIGRIRHIAGHQHTVVDPEGNVFYRGAADLVLIRKDVPEIEPGGRPAPEPRERHYIHPVQARLFQSIDHSPEQAELIIAQLEAIRTIPREQLPLFPKEAPCPPVCPTISPEKPSKYRLFPFQEEGVAWLKGRPFALLADDMGLGKTPQAIHWGADLRPVLVIVPSSLTLNWQREITTMWRPSDSLTALDGKEDLPRRLTDWTVMSYGMLNRYLPQLKRAGFRSLIIDEAHLVKNLDTQRTKNVLELVAPQEPEPGDRPIPNRLAVTGTPILNRPIEIFPLLVFLGQKQRWDFRDFLRQYTDYRMVKGRLVFTGARNLRQLHESLKPFMLRRLKSEVLKQLPPKTNTPLFMPITNADDYREAERNFLRWLIENQGPEAAFRAASAEVIVKMNTLRQLAAIGKVRPVADWLKPCKDGQGKVILFSSFKEPLDSLARIKGSDIVYTGELSPAERQEMVDRFQQQPEQCYFLGTVGAAGVGITLTAASRVAFLDLPWTPGGKIQAEDRAHRIGQTKPVEIVNILAKGTIDERMLQILQDKELVIAQAIDGRTRDEATRSSIATDLLQSFMTAPSLSDTIEEYQPELEEPEVGSITQDEVNIIQGLREVSMADIIKIRGKCDGPIEECEFKATKVGETASGTGLKGLTKAIKEVSEGQVSDAGLEAPMKLLTKEVRAKLPPLYSQEKVKDPTVWVKFFTPWTNWTWYATEFDGQDTFFGLVYGHEKELGYFSLRELQSLRGPGGLTIERDMWFKPMPLSQVEKLHLAGMTDTELQEKHPYAKALPKAIILYKTTIEKHYRPSSSMHKGSVRTIKSDGILTLLGCPKSRSWTPLGTCEKQEVILTIVPNTEKYRKEVDHLLLVHPELKSVVQDREREKGTEPRLSEAEEEEKAQIARALEKVETVSS